MWNHVRQGKGALWPVSPFSLVNLHKAASPEEQGPGVGGLHQPPLQDGPSFFVGPLRKGLCGAVWPALWDSTFKGTTGPSHSCPAPLQMPSCCADTGCGHHADRLGTE